MIRTLNIVTGNQKKFAEYDKALAEDFDIRQTRIDLLEIQGSPEEIIRFKAKEAFAKVGAACIVEDVSFDIEDWGRDLPGPYIKHFIQNMGIARMSELSYGSRATAKVLIGVAKSADDVHVIVGEVSGTIVDPRADNGFGFDLIFVPDGHDKTLSEMTIEEKNEVSHRGKAIRKLVEWLGKE